MKEVSAMEDFKVIEQKYHFVCFRCGSTVNPGDRMVNMSIDIETPTEDGSIQCIEGTTVSTLCFPCASVLLSKSIVSDPKLMMPPEQGARDEEDDEVDIDKETNESFPCFNSIQDMLETVYYGSPSDEDDEEGDESRGDC
jgi:hypothetical protein